MSTLFVDSIQPKTTGGNVGITNLTPQAGSVLQLVQVVQPDTFAHNNNTFVNITGMAATITPRSTSSKILVSSIINFGGKFNLYGYVRLLRGSTIIGEPAADGNRQTCHAALSSDNESNSGNAKMNVCATNFLDSPNTTSAITYQYQIKTYSSAYFFYLNRSHDNSNNVETPRPISTVTLTEIGG